MSVITVLCFTALIGLSLADPVPSADSTQDAQSSPTSDIQTEMQDLLNEMDDIMTNRLPPILSVLNPDDQKYLMYTAEEGLKSFLNYVLYLMYDGLDSNSAGPKPDNFILTFLTSDDSYFAQDSDSYLVTGDQDQGTGVGDQ